MSYRRVTNFRFAPTGVWLGACCAALLLISACGVDDSATPSNAQSADAPNAGAWSADAGASGTNNNNSVVMSEPDAGTESDSGQIYRSPVCPTEPAPTFDDACDLVLQPCQTPVATTDMLQEALFERAMAGDTVCFVDGEYELARSIAIDVNNLTFLGESRARTIFDFGTSAPDGGFLVTSDGFVANAMTITTDNGSGIRVTGASEVQITATTLRMENRAPGASSVSGVEMVQCRNAEIRDVEIVGADGPGIYVSQSEMVVIADSQVSDSVGGLLVENASFVEVVGNEVRENSGGIVVVGMPGQPITGSAKTKVHRNRVIANNRAYSEHVSRAASAVPVGTGILVIASDHNEIHDNVIEDNVSFGLALASFGITGRTVNTMDFDQWSEGNYFHDNLLSENGEAPTSDLARRLASLTEPADHLEAIVFDGDAAPTDQSDRVGNCFADNVDRNGNPASYLMADAVNDFAAPSTERGENACVGESLTITEPN